MLDEIGSVRNTSLTFAPEAGTQRMRDVVTKNVSEEDIAAAAAETRAAAGAAEQQDQPEERERDSHS